MVEGFQLTFEVLVTVYYSIGGNILQRASATLKPSNMRAFFPKCQMFNVWTSMDESGLGEQSVSGQNHSPQQKQRMSSRCNYKEDVSCF